MKVGVGPTVLALRRVGVLGGRWRGVGEAGNGAPAALGHGAKRGLDSLQESGYTLRCLLPIEILRAEESN